MSNSTTQANTTTQTSDFFDLHVSAFGYLNRYRVIGSGKKQFCAVTVAALRGSKDDVEYTYFDVIIRNQGISALLANYESQINDRNAKVLASVTLSDIYAETFGEPVKASIKGRLIGLKSLSVNGETVFTRSTEDAPKSVSENTIDSEMNQFVLDAQQEAFSIENESQLLWAELDPSLGSYEADKQNLISQGYMFNQKRGLWCVPIQSESVA